MTTKTQDHATLRSGGPCAAKQWAYVIDGRPECNGIAAMHYLRGVGFTTEEAGKYMRELQGPIQPMPMSAEEERHFDNPHSP